MRLRALERLRTAFLAAGLRPPRLLLLGRFCDRAVFWVDRVDVRGVRRRLLFRFPLERLLPDDCALFILYTILIVTELLLVTNR